ncbi:MAG: hypothetical protein SGPRY_012164, partial [Prymnesium sp.]
EREFARAERAARQAANEEAAREKCHAEEQREALVQRERELALAREQVERVLREGEAAVAREKAEREVAEGEAVIAGERTYRLQLEHRAAMEEERGARVRAEGEGTIALLVAARERAEKEAELHKQLARERAERAEWERRASWREDGERGGWRGEGGEGSRGEEREGLGEVGGKEGRDGRGGEGVDGCEPAVCSSSKAVVAHNATSSLSVPRKGVNSSEEGRRDGEGGREVSRRHEEELRWLRRSLEQERAAVALLEGSHRQLTAMLRESHARAARESGGEPPPPSFAAGRTISLTNPQLLTPHAAASQPKRADWLGVTPSTASRVPHMLASHRTGAPTPSTAPLPPLHPPRQTPQHFFSREGGVRLSLTDAPLVPPEAMAASLSLQEGEATSLRPLFDPVPLFALNSHSHKARVQQQLAESAKEANHAGDFKRAAELFERANSVLPSTTLLVSSLNMLLKAGCPSTALAGYGRVLTRQLTDSQRAHVQRKMCEGFVAYSSLRVERALLFLQACWRSALRRRRMATAPTPPVQVLSGHAVRQLEARAETLPAVSRQSAEGRCQSVEGRCQSVKGRSQSVEGRQLDSHAAPLPAVSSRAVDAGTWHSHAVELPTVSGVEGIHLDSRSLSTTGARTQQHTSSSPAGATRPSAPPRSSYSPAALPELNHSEVARSSPSSSQISSGGVLTNAPSTIVPMRAVPQEITPPPPRMPTLSCWGVASAVVLVFINILFLNLLPMDVAAP